MNNIKAVCIQTIHSMLLYILLVQKLHQAVYNMERITSAEWIATEHEDCLHTLRYTVHIPCLQQQII